MILVKTFYSFFYKKNAYQVSRSLDRNVMRQSGSSLMVEVVYLLRKAAERIHILRSMYLVPETRRFLNI